MATWAVEIALPIELGLWRMPLEVPGLTRQFES